MPDARIVIENVAGCRVLIELRPALECGDVIRATTDFYAHSYDEYGRVSVGSGDDCTTRILDNAPEKYEKSCTADVVTDPSKFNFVVNSLSIRSDVDKHMILEDLEDIKYLCAGSNSLIFRALWEDQDVVVKVTLKDITHNKDCN